ncbi:hypothetical protein QI155_03410 [Thermodesulfovibrio sp. 1176]|nr:hypothetical protein [Thermodesulfovibrio sp. 1176]
MMKLSKGLCTFVSQDDEFEFTEIEKKLIKLQLDIKRILINSGKTPEEAEKIIREFHSNNICRI